MRAAVIMAAIIIATAVNVELMEERAIPSVIIFVFFGCWDFFERGKK